MTLHTEFYGHGVIRNKRLGFISTTHTVLLHKLQYYYFEVFVEREKIVVV